MNVILPHAPPAHAKPSHYHTRAMCTARVLVVQKTMTTLMKLRRELDITNDEHRGWYEELKRHQQAGTLHAM